MKKRLLAIILALSFIVSVCPVALAEEDYADRFYTVQQFIYAIGTNNLEPGQPGDFTDWDTVKDEDKEVLQVATANKLLTGYEDGSLRPYDKILRIEAFVLLSRAIKDMPPTEAVITFTDTPDWATEHIDRLSAAGLVKGIGNGLLGANDYITKEHVDILADRIDSLYTTTNLKDDFYDTVNARWMRNNKIPPGYIAWSTSGEIQKRNDDIVKEIVLGYADEPEGSVRRKAYDYYLSALDTEKRNADGIEPIKPYIELLNAARTPEDIIKAMAIIAKENYMFSLLPVYMGCDEFNTDKMVLTLYAADTGMGAYYLNDKEAVDAYRKNLINLFTLAGEDEDRLRNRVDTVISFNKTLAFASLDYYSYQNISNRYNEYTLRSFKDKYPNIDLKLYFDTMGLPVPERFIVEEEEQLEIINDFLVNGMTDLLRDYVKAVLYMDSAEFLTDEFAQSMEEFGKTFYEVSESETDKEDDALYQTDSVFGAVIGADYMDMYYDDETTDYIHNMTRELIATYEERINKLDWLSVHTKASAIKKLETMRIKIGGPESYADYFSDADILSPDKGGSLLTNTSAVAKNVLMADITSLDKPFDRDAWHIPAHTVNAFYSPVNNEIVLPAGILQDPMYSPDYSYEENLGAIGSIIAHELSHAFDSSGALYDEKGNYKSWWLQEDYARFEALAEKVANRYSRIEVIDGYFVNGDYTLDENIADLGAIACVIDTAKKHEGFDFKKMFISYAYSWAEIISDKNLTTTLVTDEHSPAKVRVNGVLQNFEEFYQTFGITEEDGMYLPPNERVSIW